MTYVITKQSDWYLEARYDPNTRSTITEGNMSRSGTSVVVLALSLLCGSGSRQAYSQQLMQEKTLLGVDPVEGEAAKINNEQKLREASTSVEAGWHELQRVILNEGLRRAIPSGHKDFDNKAVSSLRICTASCDNEKATCARPVASSDILRQSSCETNRQFCEVACIQDLLGAVASIPPCAPRNQTGRDQALEEQREDAQVAFLIQDFRSARHGIDKALADLQAVSLEEGIRQTLEKYKEYGVPSGETTVNGAVDTQTTCTEKTFSETGDCIQTSASRSVEKEVTICKPDGECVTYDQVGFSGLANFFLRSLNCLAAGVTKELGCSKAMQKRFGVE